MHLLHLQPELDCQQLEIIELPMGESTRTQCADLTRRKPSPLLTGSVVMADDLIAPATPDEDWDVLK